MAPAQSRLMQVWEDQQILTSIKFYHEAQRVLVEIEDDENPDELKNVALLMVTYITQQASERLQRPAWICSTSFCLAKGTAWPEDNDPL